VTAAAATRRTPARATPACWVVAAQECRDLWLGGRGPLLLLGFSLLLSAVSYLTASNLALNFLEQREAVNLVLQVAVVVGALVALVSAADGISGERERGTLESLLLAPVSRRAILAGKFVAVLSVWFAAFAASVPYLVVLARGVSLVGAALALGLLVGTLLAVALAAVGLLVSVLSSSNKVSLAASFLLLLALYAPTQLPRLPASWSGDAMRRGNPVASALYYLSGVLVNGHGWTRDLSYLEAPLAAAVLGAGLLFVVGPRVNREAL
jgi:ABC-2 type transport system permease protein